MPTELERLVVTLEASTRQYERALAKAQQVTVSELRKIHGAVEQHQRRNEAMWYRMGERIGSSIRNGLRNSMRGVATTIIAGFGIHKVGQEVKQVFEYVSELRDVSNRLRMPTTQLQAWHRAAQATGESVETVNRALETLQTNLQTKGSFVQRFFAANQQAITGTAQDITTFQKLFARVPASKRAFVLEQTVGFRSRGLQELFQGTSLVAHTQAELARKGLLYTKEEIAKIDEQHTKWIDMMQDVETRFGKWLANLDFERVNAAAVTFINTLTRLVEVFLKLPPAAQQGIIGGAIGSAVGGLPGAVIGGSAGGLMGSQGTGGLGGGAGRDVLGPSGFIFHHTGGRGTVAGVKSTLRQRGLSVQYIMDRQGNIVATGLGVGQARHMRRGQGAGKGLSNANTLGMEIIARNDADVTEAQIAAAQRFIAEKFPGVRVFGHGEVNPHKQATEGSRVVAAIRSGRAGGGGGMLAGAGGSNVLSSGSGGLSVDITNPGGEAVVPEADRLLEYIEALKAEQRQLGMTNREREIAVALQQAGNIATSEGTELTAAQSAEIENLVGATADQRQMLEHMNQISDALGSAAQGFVNDLMNGVEAGEAFSNMLKNLASQLVNMAIQNLFSMGGAPGGLFGSLLGGVAKAQHGLHAKVGGSGGTDSKLVAFRATPGEMIDVTPRGKLRAGGRGGGTFAPNTSITVNGNMDEAMFHRVGRMIEANNQRQRASLHRDFGQIQAGYQMMRGP